MDILNQVLYKNTISEWLVAILLLAVITLVLYILKKIVIHRLERSRAKKPGDLVRFLQNLIAQTSFIFIISLASYFGVKLLELPESVVDAVNKWMIMIALVQVGVWGGALINYLLRYRLEQVDGVDAATFTTLNAVRMVAKIVLWSIIVLLILENVTGIEMNALLASLGIAGVAGALAIQNILGDLFASLSIALDKPFVIGDSITVDQIQGEVEHIGLKSTHLRSVTGEQIIFSNSDLLESRIHNFQRMDQRRVTFKIGVIRDTPYDKLSEIPGIIKNVIEQIERTTFERAHFRAYGDSALIFECVYVFNSAEASEFIQVENTINMELYRQFTKYGIELAYPSQTVFLQHAVMEPSL